LPSARFTLISPDRRGAHEHRVGGIVDGHPEIAGASRASPMSRQTRTWVSINSLKARSDPRNASKELGRQGLLEGFDEPGSGEVARRLAPARLGRPRNQLHHGLSGFRDDDILAAAACSTRRDNVVLAS